ncbi:hypothetical protein DAPPUDRAFT_334868 [Daphnia pulex]|uniref:Hemimethylated DNA-binding domain-containing protein n=1 Tax=Daphnia pulex TaxID=6669 RepID=E9HWL0_DAPPU|nr:hypothetical protein DAPPUDRAFT_334868 [Daphnia pulex]|eukprot:EFX63874.1 hypothetical protein DAPPUDRAFT_334868 [Daphnia pulex]
MAMSVDTLLHRHSNPNTPLYIVIYVEAVSTVEEGGGCQAHEALNVITGCLKTLLGIHRTELSVDVVFSNRLESVKYAVGFVMDLYCYGKSIENFDQPFYEILVDKANSKYVPEEQMELHLTPGLADVKNRDLGLLFQKFDGLIFVPNVVCQARLPEDEEFA